MVVTFAQSAFGGTACPTDHPKATCYSGGGSASIAGVGHVTLDRIAVTGDGPDPGNGCDYAETTGTLTADDGGSATLSGSGKLCGADATYSLELVGRSGSLAHLHATGTILNNNGAETWDIATLTR